MFEKNEGARDLKSAETVIGSSVKVEGNFAGEGDVIVEGIVLGNLKTAKNLKIGDQAKVKADVEAENIFIAGEIRGNVKCRGRLEMTGSARILGNVETNVLQVEAGAVLNGKCSMVSKGEEAAVENPMPEEEFSKEKRNKKS
jgi:cytoskeletal protein CcmA (bactofilin family)